MHCPWLPLQAGFKWLVGPMEIQETEVEFGGKKQIWRSQVKITKCRYLENSGCVGMCTNMCKVRADDAPCVAPLL